MEDYKYLDYFEIEDGMDMEITIKFSNFLEVTEKVDGETITLYFLEDGQPGTYARTATGMDGTHPTDL